MRWLATAARLSIARAQARATSSPFILKCSRKNARCSSCSWSARCRTFKLSSGTTFGYGRYVEFLGEPRDGFSLAIVVIP